MSMLLYNDKLKKINSAYLSWKDTKKLATTISTHKILLHHTYPSVFFQEPSDQDFDLAKKHNIKTISSRENIGIANAFIQLVNYAINQKLEYFIFLQNDFEITENANKSLKFISTCIDIIDSGKADLIHMLSANNPGSPMWCWKDRGIVDKNSRRKLESRFWQNPANVYPEQIKQEKIGVDTWYFTDSKNQNWTNMPCICRTQFLKDFVLPTLEQNKEANHYSGFEKVMAGFLPWHRHLHKIAASSSGIFTHCGHRKNKQ